MIKHAGGIVQDQAIDLAHADYDLEGMAQRMGGGNEDCNDQAQGTPGKLSISKLAFRRRWVEG